VKRRDDTYIDAPPHQLSDVPNGAARIVELAKDDFRAFAERGSRFGQKHALADALEQWRSQGSFELRDLLRHAWL
jgi:hypothetical protein